MEDWSWTIGFIVATTLIYLIHWYRRPPKLPPGPRGIPIFGYLPMFTKRPEYVARDLSRKYGPLISVRMGSEEMIFLNDFETINTALVKNGSTLSGRPRFANIEEIKKGHGIVFTNDGDAWKRQRKFGLTTLRGFGVGTKGMETICLEELEFLNQEIKNRNGKAFNISHILHNAVANNICSITMGKRYDHDDPNFQKIVEQLIERFDDPVRSFVNKLIIMVPAVKNIPPFSYYYRKNKKYLEKSFEWFHELIEEHEKTFDENNLRDFIDAFLLEKRKGSDPSFTDFQLVNYIHELFVAGAETTSSTLYWGLLCFLHYPETQKKLRKEIYDVLGSSGSFSMSKKANMPYTNAFVQELFRFRTLAPLSVVHNANDNTVINGFVIPKGTKVQPNLWAVHNDPEIWENPDHFKPERFLDEKGNFVKSNYVIPFSLGQRHCLGEQLARMEVYIFLVGMVQKFEFLPDPQDINLPSIAVESGGLVSIPTPYKLVANVIE